MEDIGGTAIVGVEAEVLAHTGMVTNIVIMKIVLVDMEVVGMTEGMMMWMSAMVTVAEEHEAVAQEGVGGDVAGAIVLDATEVQFVKAVLREGLRLNNGTGKENFKHHLLMFISLHKMEDLIQINQAMVIEHADLWFVL